MLFLGVLALLAMCVLLCARRAFRPGKDSTPRCAACAYDLTSFDPASTKKCPECGALILETGIERRGPNGGRVRRRVCVAYALACALAMGFLMLLKYPPVMQSFVITREGPLLQDPSIPYPVVLTQTTVKHPRYTTNPLVYLIPGFREKEVLERSLVLDRPGATNTSIDITLAEDPGLAVDQWLTTHSPRMVDSMRSSLGLLLGELGFDVSSMGRMELEGMWMPMESFWDTQISATSPSPQPAIAQRMGLAPSIGVDWKHTTWLQISNVVWYALPACLTVWLFSGLIRRSRSRAVGKAREWACGAEDP